MSIEKIRDKNGLVLLIIVGAFGSTILCLLWSYKVLGAIIGFVFCSLFMTFWGIWIPFLAKEKEENNTAAIKEKEEIEYGCPASIIGREGFAETRMMPSGLVEIDCEIFEAVSVFGGLDRGERVKVLSVEGSYCKVKKVW